MAPEFDMQIITLESPRVREIKTLEPGASNNTVSNDFWWRVISAQIVCEVPFSEWKDFPMITLGTGNRHEIYINSSQLVVPGMDFVPLHFVVPHKQNMMVGAFKRGPEKLPLEIPLGIRFTWEPFEMDMAAWRALRAAENY